MRKLIFIGFLLLGGWSRGDSGDDSVPQIPVVHTWGDLLKTKPISVESPAVIFPNAKPEDKGQTARVSIQLGLDRDHLASQGGVVLYGLVKGVSFGGTQGSELGPFLAHIRCPKNEFISLATTCSKPLPFKESSYLLFSRVVPLSRSGKYEIELYLAPKRELVRFGGPNQSAVTVANQEQPAQAPKVWAKAQVIVTGEPRLPWSPWGLSKREKMKGPWSRDVLYTKMTVTNPWGAIAIPEAPKIVVLDNVPPIETPLPVLVPEFPDPGTNLKLVDSNLIVTTSQAFVVYYPNDHFLTRWWVNGKPWVPEFEPKGLEAEGSTVRSIEGNIWYLKQVRFDLDFRPERLGVKRGDKIGVQVLFCPGGWQTGGTSTMYSSFLGPDPDEVHSLTQFSYPSNRVDFIYSGDPAHFQQK